MGKNKMITNNVRANLFILHFQDFFKFFSIEFYFKPT